jgi:hypothetical protein
MDEKDYVCKVDCPIDPKGDRPYCCGKCHESRLYFVTKTNKHLWTEMLGFWSHTGCRLKREDMPAECRAYNCHDYSFIGIMEYIGEKWRFVEVVELLNHEIMPVKMAVNATLGANRRGNSS